LQIATNDSCFIILSRLFLYSFSNYTKMKTAALLLSLGCVSAFQGPSLNSKTSALPATAAEIASLPGISNECGNRVVR
jgi:hypothetical protein